MAGFQVHPKLAEHVAMVFRDKVRAFSRKARAAMTAVTLIVNRDEKVDAAVQTPSTVADELSNPSCAKCSAVERTICFS